MHFQNFFIIPKRNSVPICYGLNCVPQERDIEVLTPSTSNCDLIWKQGFYRGKLVKMKSLKWDLIQYVWYSPKGNLDTNTCTEGRWQEEKQGKCHVKMRDWSAASTSQWTPRLPAHYHKEARKGFPAGFRGSLALADNLISDIQPPEPWDSQFLFVKPSSWWYFVTATLGNECTMTQYLSFPLPWSLLTFILLSVAINLLF